MNKETGLFKGVYPADVAGGVGSSCAGAGIRPVFASIVGSRLHGVASKKSDWDVRVVYVHGSIKDYFSINEKPTSMKPQACAIAGDAVTDIMALEFEKFVHLLMHSSPNALEQVYSHMQLGAYTMDGAAKVLKDVADAFLDPVSLSYGFLGFINSCRSSLVRGAYQSGRNYYTRNARKKLFHMQRLYAMEMYVHNKAADGVVEFPPIVCSECMAAVGDPFSDVGLALVGNPTADELDEMLRVVDETCIPNAERMAAEVKTMEVARRSRAMFDMEPVERLYHDAAHGLLGYGGERDELKVWLHSVVERSVE